jgi:hypothetical protein
MLLLESRHRRCLVKAGIEQWHPAIFFEEIRFDHLYKKSLLNLASQNRANDSYTLRDSELRKPFSIDFLKISNSSHKRPGKHRRQWRLRLLRLEETV